MRHSHAAKKKKKAGMTTSNLAPTQEEAVGSSSEVVSMPWHIPLSAVGIVMERTWLQVEEGQNESRGEF